MPFPIKNYFYLNEVSNRWHRSVKDVEYCIENGLIPVYIKVFSVKLCTHGQTPRNSSNYSGCKCISPDDCHFLFSIRGVNVSLPMIVIFYLDIINRQLTNLLQMMDKRKNF